MQPALSVTNLGKRFDKSTAVDGVSFSLPAGNLLGIVGPNGAGKSTTIKCILGLLNPDQGEVKVLGGTMQQLSVRQRVGYMPEAPSFFAHLSGRELLELVGSLFGLRGKALRKRADELLSRVGLSEAGRKPLSNYSKGMLQRICLAQAIINRPDLLFLDEPMDGLDPIGRIRMKELLLEIKQSGTAVVLNSHILSDVAELADQIAIMDKGKLLKSGTTSEVIPKGKTLEQVFIEVIGVS
jgi:ABC-2 type transport system ATP-binding protein